ncbi:molybdenum cofactor guanylyltransferase MobA [Xylophilus sp.]|uniref:molybdenum cofactor guanylyltransferase MobA n=1 Tax=Xylophilus sp. TaxID=2653893 RepID=UPI0013BA32DE|nr:molybdenum cofactor guanylyltransferase MobA [Xylophilus sp.]KAF1047183.1 MAG: Molybdenum cofactor guanylyltransferase [Xylophilus sp.]
MRAGAITGLVLAGGRGSRMGGVDKGLQAFGGATLAARALLRLRPQAQRLAISANRHLDRYGALGVPVWPDADGGFAGPLAGMLAGLAHCTTDWLVTVPCDAPYFPADLVARLLKAAQHQDALLAHAAGPGGGSGGDRLRDQPVFALLHASLRDDLAAYLASGGRKVGAWMAAHRPAVARFDAPGDDPTAFANANTLDELSAWERHGP